MIAILLDFSLPRKDNEDKRTTTAAQNVIRATLFRICTASDLGSSQLNQVKQLFYHRYEEKSPIANVQYSGQCSGVPVCPNVDRGF